MGDSIVAITLPTGHAPLHYTFKAFSAMNHAVVHPHTGSTAMPTQLHTLAQDSEDWDNLHRMYRTTPFLQGLCYEFAIALHEGLGWPMVGLMKGETIWHAGVRMPDGRLHDVRGALTEEEFGSYFLSSPFVIRPVTIEEMRATRPLEPYSMKRARQLAEILWPTLPWIETEAARVKAFVDELETLSRKHGFWITASVPAQPPRLFTGCGDEGGYRVCPTVDGLAHTITRYLKNEIEP